MTDHIRAPGKVQDPNEYLTDPMNVKVHVLRPHEEPMFLTNSSTQYSVWRLGYNTGSTIMVKVEKVGVESSFSEGLDDRFKEHVQRLFREYVASIKTRFSSHHLVVAEPKRSAGHNGDDGPTYTTHATVGFFSVPSSVHVRLYGRTVEIPQLPTSDVEGDPGKPTPAEVNAVVGPTRIDAELEKERKQLTNELMGFAVDLLKAGSGNYAGEAAQTLRNLVSSRLGEVLINNPETLDRPSKQMWQNVFLSKSLVKLTGLGKFVLPLDKHEYFGQRCIEKVSQMKAERGIPLHQRPAVNIVKVGELSVPVALNPADRGVKADLHAEAEKARERIRAKRAEIDAAKAPKLDDFNPMYGNNNPAPKTEFEEGGGQVENIWKVDDVGSDVPLEISVDRPDGLG